MKGFQDYFLRSVSFLAVCHMTVVDVHDGMFQVVFFKVVYDNFTVRSELSRKAISKLFQ